MHGSTGSQYFWIWRRILHDVSHLDTFHASCCHLVAGGPQDQLDALIAQIRTEKYFEAHGIRTPLPAARVAVKEEAEFEFVDDEMVPQLQWGFDGCIMLHFGGNDLSQVVSDLGSLLLKFPTLIKRDCSVSVSAFG